MINTRYTKYNSFEKYRELILFYHQFLFKEIRKKGYLKKSCVDNNGEKCLGCLGPDGICFFDQKSYEECEEGFISGYK